MSTASSRRLALSYALLALVLAKTLWGIWGVRDLTYGDTASYFSIAQRFASDRTCHFCWSPLYTSFLGTLFGLSGDPYVAVTLHRVVVVATAAILIFEVGRRLFSIEIALLISCWWAVLPINHAALYEIHLFAALPYIVFWLVLAESTSSQARAVALAVLAASMVLVRNETVITFLLFGAASMLHDSRSLLAQSSGPRLRRMILTYAIPLAVAIACIATAYARSQVQFPELASAIRDKEALNVGQNYAFGYGQRNPSYTDNPWTDYPSLMRRQFGTDRLTMRAAFARNPAAMIEHCEWNASLVPAGLQVGLFNARTGAVDPDFAPTLQSPVAAGAATALFLAVVLTGVWLMWRNRAQVLATEHSRWLLTAVLAVAVNMAVVMVMVRPRPSFLFPMAISLMFLFGKCLEVIFESMNAVRVLRVGAVVVVGAILALVPGYYTSRWATLDPGCQQDRPLYELLQVMQQVRKEQPEYLDGPVAIPGYTFEIWSYLGLVRAPNRFVDSTDLLVDKNGDPPPLLRCRDLGARMVVLAPRQAHLPLHDRLLEDAVRNGWRSRTVPVDGKDYVVLWTADDAPTAK